jgi:hypothetical protein
VNDDDDDDDALRMQGMVAKAMVELALPPIKTGALRQIARELSAAGPMTRSELSAAVRKAHPRYALGVPAASLAKKTGAELLEHANEQAHLAARAAPETVPQKLTLTDKELERRKRWGAASLLDAANEQTTPPLFVTPENDDE